MSLDLGQFSPERFKIAWRQAMNNLERLHKDGLLRIEQRHQLIEPLHFAFSVVRFATTTGSCPAELSNWLGRALGAHGRPKRPRKA